MVAVARRASALTDLPTARGAVTLRDCDITDPTAVHGLFADLADRSVEVVVYNAGTFRLLGQSIREVMQSPDVPATPLFIYKRKM